MPGTMEEKAERGFMSIRKNNFSTSSRPLSRDPGKSTLIQKFLSWLLLVFLLACSNELFDSPIPEAIFEDIVINVSNPEYNNLHTLGYVYVGGDAGVRGIILYKENTNTYRAFERNCSYQPNDACATVDVHISTLFMQDSCCGSTFGWDGNPTGGVAWRPLRQYQTFLDGNMLTITDEVIN
jgi:hypothetical protein